MSAVLTAEQALKLVGEMFVYHMPFNRALGMELERYEKEFAQLAFKNQPMMVGNWAQSILHGGVIASALDVAAGIVTTVPLLCFTAAATRLRLSTLGFFQYIGPTLMFLLAVTFYGEKPGADKMVTFAFIWVALAIFVMDAIYTQRRTSK